MGQKLISGFLIFLGFLLSPLCWWNDLIFNLPLAYGVGAIGKIFSADLFWPFAMVGYWLTNLVGIVLMQFGSQGLLQSNSTQDYKKELVKGFVFSSLYTIAFLILLKLNIFEQITGFDLGITFQ